MKHYLFSLFILLVITGKGVGQVAAERKEALKEFKTLMENKPFVNGTTVYEIYDVTLSECTLNYKVYITGQDNREGKTFIHRNYSLQLQYLKDPSFYSADSSLFWIVLPANTNEAITENILPDKKSKMIPLSVSKKFLSFASIPVYKNDPGFLRVINRLVSSCQSN